MIYINILEKSGEVQKILKNILSVNNVKDVCVNEENSPYNVHILNIADTEDENVDLLLFKQLKLLIINLESMSAVKNIPPNIQIITCGSNEKDSFTFTSINESTHILTLQRPIRNIHDDVILPFEFKVQCEKYELNGFENENILFAFCIYLCISEIGRNSL